MISQVDRSRIGFLVSTYDPAYARFAPGQLLFEDRIHWGLVNVVSRRIPHRGDVRMGQPVPGTCRTVLGPSSAGANLLPVQIPVPTVGREVTPRKRRLTTPIRGRSESSLGAAPALFAKPELVAPRESSHALRDTPTAPSPGTSGTIWSVSLRRRDIPSLDGPRPPTWVRIGNGWCSPVLPNNPRAAG